MNEIVKKNGIKYGIIAGILASLITLGIYIIDLKLFISWWIGIISIIVFVGLCLYLMATTKKQLINNFSFKDAFTTYFIFIVIAIAISSFVKIGLFNFVDTEAKDTVNELTIEYMVTMFKKMNMPTEAIKAGIEEIKNNNPLDVFQIIKGALFQIAIYSVFGLILAAIFKSKKQEVF